LTSVVIGDSVTSIGEYAFYQCYKLTIYCKAESQPSGWHAKWNYSNRPVVWVYKEKSYPQVVTELNKKSELPSITDHAKETTPYVDINFGLSEEKMKRFFKDSFMIGTTHYTDGGIVGPSGQWIPVPLEAGRLVTETKLADYATQSQLTPLATKTELNSYATKTELNSYATKTALNNYATKTALNNYATLTQFNNLKGNINNANANYYEIAAGGKFEIHRSGMYIILSSGNGTLSLYKPDNSSTAVISSADSLLMMTVPYSTSPNSPLFVAMGAQIGSSIFNADSIQVELTDGSYVTCNTKFYVGEIAFKKIT
jgi:hypothetical protein